MDWLTGWTYRKKITVNSSEVTGTPTNFTVRRRITADTDMGGATQFLGHDLRVTESDGQTLTPHCLAAFHAIAQGDAVWTWFNDPRAIYDNGALYVGFIDSSGNVKVGKFVVATQTWTVGTVVAALEVDDHDNPALHIRDDGKILVVYSMHNGTAYSAVSTSAGDVSAWGTPVAFSGTRSYATLVQVSSGRLYYFFRDGPAAYGLQSFQTSDDDGDTWAAKVQMFDVLNERPYAKYRINANDPDRIDVAITNGHPNEVACSIYHFAIIDTAGTRAYEQTDGTLIGDDTALPLGTGDVTLVYDGTTNDGWVQDVASDAAGDPVIVYVQFVGGSSDQRYRYARWSGSAWADNQIVAVGAHYNISGDPFYAPGIALDPADPDIVYLVNLNNISCMLKYETADDGANWGAPTAVGDRAATIGRYAMRPYVPVNAPATIPVVWIDGDYSGGYTSYDTHLVVPYGPAATSIDLDLFFLADSLSSGADTDFYLYWGKSDASDAADAAAAFPDDFVVAVGNDWAFESLALLITDAIVDKRTTGLVMVEESGGTNGTWQRHGGALNLNLGTLLNLQSDTAFSMAITVQPQSGGNTTQYFASCWAAATAAFMFRYATADMQPEFLFINSGGTNSGGKFSDIVLANDVKRRFHVTWDQANGIDGWRDATQSATTHTAASAFNANATTAQLQIGSSPHTPTGSRYKGYWEMARISSIRWSDDFIATEYGMLADLSAFTTVGTLESTLTLSTPADLAIIADSTPTFTWTGGVAPYVLKLVDTDDDNDDFDNPTVTVTGINGTSYALVTPLDRTNYDWRVEDANGAISAEWSFSRSVNDGIRSIANWRNWRAWRG